MPRTARKAPFAPVLSAALCAGIIWGGAAFAQSSALGGFKVDSTLPIEISADALEVRQEQQTAVFTGSVDARQGEVRMQAQQLTVTYDQNSEAQGAAAAQAGAIRRVRAEGSVFVSSPEGSAEGNWADYDVATGTVTMGDDVTLVQGGENVLAGGRLSIDLNTGFARIERGSGRVQGLFFPPKN